MESFCANTISDTTQGLAGIQWSSVDKNDEQYFKFEIISSTDEDQSVGKNSTEKVTLIQHVRQVLTSAVRKIDSNIFRRRKSMPTESTLNCEISKLVG
jgi:hypothetical protein